MAKAKKKLKHYQTGADSCACGNLWPCTRMTGPGEPKPPSRTRFDGDIKGFAAHELAAELKQIKIDFECGPGPTWREKLAAREENIRDELHRRNKLTEQALQREEAIRGKGARRERPLIPDKTIQTVVATAEVKRRIELWLEACHTGKLDGCPVRDVEGLVYKMQSEIEDWVSTIEDSA